MQLPKVTAAGSILWRDYIFGERKCLVRYILWAIDASPAGTRGSVVEHSIAHPNSALSSSTLERKETPGLLPSVTSHVTYLSLYPLSSYFSPAHRLRLFRITQTGILALLRTSETSEQHRQKGLSRAWSWMFLGGKVPAPSGWTLMFDFTRAEITCWDPGIFRVNFTHRNGLEQERGWLKSPPSPSRVVLASRSDSEKEMFETLKDQTSGPLCHPTSSFAECALLHSIVCMLTLRSCCNKKKGGQLS